MIFLLPDIFWVIAKIRSNQILVFQIDKFHWKVFMGNLKPFPLPILPVSRVTGPEHARTLH